jgi:hypothetical protein
MGLKMIKIMVCAKVDKTILSYLLHVTIEGKITCYAINRLSLSITSYNYVPHAHYIMS